MICSQCFAENADSTNFCESCGASLVSPAPPQNCGACGFERRASAKFCANCGARFPDECPAAPALEATPLPLTSGPADPLDATRKAAAGGDAESQFQLGLAYDMGEGLAEDNRQAVSWYCEAADQGHARAQYYLGIMYATGQGVKQDDAQAVEWNRKAAEQGDVDAQFSLGLSYESGIGVAQDKVKATAWYIKAARQGHSRAQSFTGEAPEKLPESPPPAKAGTTEPPLAAEPIPVAARADGTAPIVAAPPAETQSVTAIEHENLAVAKPPGEPGRPVVPPSGWHRLETRTPPPASRPPAAAAPRPIEPSDMPVVAKPRGSRMRTVVVLSVLVVIGLSVAFGLILRNSIAQPAVESSSTVLAPLELPTVNFQPVEPGLAPAAVQVPVPDAIDATGDVASYQQQTQDAPPDPVAPAAATPTKTDEPTTRKPPKAKRKPPVVAVEAAPEPVAEPVATVAAAHVAAAASLDDQYEQQRAECKSGFLGSRCRKKIRVSLCAGQWADAPVAGTTVCQTRNQ